MPVNQKAMLFLSEWIIGDKRKCRAFLSEFTGVQLVIDYSGRSAHALKRVQRMRIAV
jgi:hypothetical protein